MYNKVTTEDLAFFNNIVTTVYVGDDIKEDYTKDEMTFYGKYVPEAVVLAENTQQVSDILKYCNKHMIPVTARGAGTGLCGGSVAIKGGIILSLEKMNKILEVDEDVLTTTVEAGIIYLNLAKELEITGLYYAPDPGEKSATIGGNISTNAGGMRAVKLGVTRDYVRGMEVVLANGDIIELGGKIAKNSSGYSLKDLIIGAEGTLGIVTKATLKLLPKPNNMISLLIPFDNLETCLNVVPKIYRLPNTPTTLEFMEKEVIEDAKVYLGKSIPNAGANAYLIVSYTGNDDEDIKKGYEECAELVLANGALDAFISDTDERQDNMWSARGAFLEAINTSTDEMDECDVVVPIYEIFTFMEYVKELASEYKVRIRSFGHAGDGNLHVYVCKDQLAENVWHKTVKEVMDKLYTYAKELGGQVSGEHGIGHAKTEYLIQSLDETQIALMRNIKNVFDPNNILNPGKVIK